MAKGQRPTANDEFRNRRDFFTLLSEPRHSLGAGYNPAGHMQKIAILYDASQAVLSTFDLDEVLQRILVIARDYFHLQNVAILLLDKEQTSFASGPRSAASRDLTDVRVSIGTGLIGTAAQKKRPLYVPDFAKETRYQPWGKKTRSELAIPLMVRDEVVGVLDCQSENPDHFDSETVDLLTLFSTQASMALQNATPVFAGAPAGLAAGSDQRGRPRNHRRAGRERTSGEGLPRRSGRRSRFLTSRCW